MARVARAEAIQTERRRRSDATLDRVHQQKLAIPAEFRGDNDHEYRWINDENSRVYDLTVEDDWNICHSSRVEGSDDDRVRRQVGTKKTGEPLYAFLVRKRKDWYDADKREKAEKRAEAEQQLLKKPPTDNPQAGATVTAGSSIRRGPYAP
jgi:hypothetical protein